MYRTIFSYSNEKNNPKNNLKISCINFYSYLCITNYKTIYYEKNINKNIAYWRTCALCQL